MGARGEGIIQSDENEYHVRFDNRAMSAACRQLDKPIMEIVGIQFAGDGDDLTVNTASTIQGMRPDYIAVLLREGLESHRRVSRAGGRPATTRDAEAVINEVGLVSTFMQVLLLIIPALGLDQDDADRPYEADDPND